MAEVHLGLAGNVDIDAQMYWFLVEEYCDLGKVSLSFDDIKEGNQFQFNSVLKKCLHLVTIRGNFEFRVDRSNVNFYILDCTVDRCNWTMCGSRIF